MILKMVISFARGVTCSSSIQLLKKVSGVSQGVHDSHTRWAVGGQHWRGQAMTDTSTSHLEAVTPGTHLRPRAPSL